MTRTFIAIELTDTVRAALARERAHLARTLPAIRWADPAGMHLTLAFLGELDDARLADATAAAQEAAHAGVPFALEVSGLGTFGPEWAPRVVWAGVRGQTHALLALHGGLAGALERCGFAREARPFAPHLTLARITGRLDAAARERLATLAAAAGERPLAAWPVSELSVMKSELSRTGARYTRLRACSLAATAP